MTGKLAWLRRRGFWPFYSFILFMLAFPGFNLWPLAWVCLVPYLLFLEQEKKWLKIICIPPLAFLIPVAYGYFGFFFFSPFDYIFFVVMTGIGIIPVSLLVTWLLRVTNGFPATVRNIYRAVGIACIWVLLEMARSMPVVLAPTGGLLLGYSQCYNLPVLQFASLFGVYGLSFLVVLFNVAVFLLMRPRPAGEPRALGVPLIIFALVAVVVASGFVRYHTYPDAERTLRVAVVQPNISGDVPLDAEERIQAEWQEIGTLERLMRVAAQEKPEIIILPERIFPGLLLNEDDPQTLAFKQLIKELGIPVIVGAIHMPRHSVVYNSAYFLRADGSVWHRYDKVVLFPIGEYFPGLELLEKVVNYFKVHKHYPELFEPGAQYEEYLNLVEYLDVGWEILAAGEQQVVFRLPEGYSIAAPICAEDMVPWFCRRFVREEPDFMAVITNDVWLRRTATVEHHLLGSIMRAVENNISIVRAANTGISAIILPTGKITHTVKDEKGQEKMIEGYVVGTVPLAPPPSFYNRYGHLFGAFMQVVAIFVLFFTLALRRRSKK